MSEERQLEELVAAGRHAEALRIYRQLSPEQRETPGLALQAARAASYHGDFETAKGLAEIAVVGYRAAADEAGRMRAVNVIGAIAFERGELRAAADAFREVFDLAMKRDDCRMIARSLNNLASVASLEGEMDLAASYYRSAILAYRRLDDLRGIAESYANLGIVHRMIGDWEAAERSYEEAARYARRQGDPYLLVLTRTGSAELHLERRDLAAAGRELERAAELAALAGDEVGQTEISRLRALLALAADEPAAAHHRARETRNRARQQGLRVIESECCALSARALKRLGDLREAESFRAKATAGFRAIGAKALLERFEREWETA